MTSGVDSKVFLISVPNEVGVQGLIGDGKLLKFGYNGVCLGEYPLIFDATLQEVDIISLLQVGTDVEVGYNIGRKFFKKPAKKSISEIASIVNNHSSVVFLGRRDGAIDGAKFSQYIYVFRYGVLTPSFEL